MMNENYLLVALIILMLWPMAVLAKDYAPSKVEMELIPVSEHVYYVQGKAGVATDNEGFISNAGVVITDEGVILFDALGTPSLAQKLMGLIAEKTDQPVKKVIVSHYHADHIYGLQVFKDAGAEILAPTGAENYLDSPNAENRLQERRVSLFPWVDDNTRLVRPDVYVDQSMDFNLGGVEFRVTHLGDAHSDADLMLYVLPDKVLLSGDIIFEGRVPFVGSANTKNWLKTLIQLETDNVQALIPGHGPAASEPAQAITMTKNYLAFLRQTMGAAVDEMMSFSEAYDEADWSDFNQLPAFDEANRRNAYQVYLSLEAEALGQ
jgi:glyoxylase-like metal-dependent hydrolase (beta-lactamase superfamily II)